MRNLSKTIIILLFFCIPFASTAQIGGSHTYQFLSLPNSARVAALGGNFLAIKDDDITLAIANPSLITKDMNNKLALSYISYYADVNYGFAAYSHSFNKIGSFVGSIQYINYGTFTKADVTGETYGTFKAGEYAFNLGWAKPLDSNFSIGSNLKAISSSLEIYSSFGLAVDVAATYQSNNKRFVTSLMFKNIGRQLSYYTEADREALPFEIQLGLSERLKHAPFRFSLLLNHLEKWDLTYEDPLNPSIKIDPLTKEVIEKSKFSKFGDQLMRHVVLGVEFVPSNSFNIRFGYNYQRRQEMKVESALSTVGFSWGFGFRVSKFYFSYAHVIQHLASSSNFFTIATNLSAF
ncbi:MAG: type IX secretion system protein PorQ [Bacteroidetes bacterium]|nr:type IX secretion system protein PorQ [Bacteroidota bacterium]